jgi:hypothetical protein
VGLLLVGVVLVVLAVVLVVELLGVLLGLVLGLLAVEEVLALGLGEAVDFTTGEASEELLGELVGDGLAWWGVSVSGLVVGFRLVGSTYPPCAACPRTSSWP